MRKCLTSAARCSIKMRSQEPYIGRAVKPLLLDLVNGPLHCFGHHNKCTRFVCERELASAVGGAYTYDAKVEETCIDEDNHDDVQISCESGNQTSSDHNDDPDQPSHNEDVESKSYESKKIHNLRYT